jgi:type IV pilus assembly protein PilM
MALFQTTAKPRLACEITPGKVIAARANAVGTGLDLYTFRRLRDNALAPSLGGNNIVDTGAVQEAIGGAISAVAGRRRDVITIIPDAAVRVLLLDFDALPEKHVDAAPLVRFRIRKSLPFDVDSAALSFQSRRENGNVKVLAAVTPRDVLAGYESAVRAAGFLPGVVLPSTLAMLAPVVADTPTLVVNVEGAIVTMVIIRSEEVLLYRTLDCPRPASISGAEIADSVYPSIVFFEDTYSARVQRILLAGSELRDIASALHAQTGIQPEELHGNVTMGESLSGESLAPSSLAGIAGVLVH